MKYMAWLDAGCCLGVAVLAAAQNQAGAFSTFQREHAACMLLHAAFCSGSLCAGSGPGSFQLCCRLACRDEGGTLQSHMVFYGLEGEEGSGRAVQALKLLVPEEYQVYGQIFSMVTRTWQRGSGSVQGQAVSALGFASRGGAILGRGLFGDRLPDSMGHS